MANERTVSDLMTRELVTLNEEDNLANLNLGMQRYHLRHLPVVDEGKLVGLVSHRDLLRAMAARTSSDTFVASVMTRGVQTVSPETTIADAARILVENKFGCLPVVNQDGALIGIVTEHDLLKHLVRASR